jgi:hypothetical protein
MNHDPIPTIYGITAFRNEFIQTIDGEHYIHSSGFMQHESFDRNEIIKEWADIMVQDTNKVEGQELYNVFIHVNGIPVFDAITGSVEFTGTSDSSGYTYLYKDDVAQLLLSASMEADATLKQQAQAKWMEYVEQQVALGKLPPTNGPGRRI